MFLLVKSNGGKFSLATVTGDIVHYSSLVELVAQEKGSLKYPVDRSMV